MSAKKDKYAVSVVLFEDFELLDVFGPLEMFGMLPDNFSLLMTGENRGPVRSFPGPEVLAERSLASFTTKDILLIPGGRGTRREVYNQRLIEEIRKHAVSARYVLTVCTGAALLARTGLLDGVRATSNKLAFDWVKSQNGRVLWVPEARWVEDGKYFTSSGVSAGMDMALGFIDRLFGKDTSLQVARLTEYERHSDPSRDPFARPSRGR